MQCWLLLPFCWFHKPDPVHLQRRPLWLCWADGLHVLRCLFGWVLLPRWVFVEHSKRVRRRDFFEQGKVLLPVRFWLPFYRFHRLLLDA